MGDLLNFDAEMEALFEEKPFPRRGDYCIRIYALSELTSLETFARLRTCVKTLDEKDPPDKTMVTLSGMSGGALQFLLDKGSSWVDIVSREQGGKGDLVAEIGDLVPDPSTGKTSYTRGQKPKRSKSGSPNSRAGDKKLQLLGESTSSSKRAVTPPRRAESGPPAEQASASGTAADQTDDADDLETNKTEPSYSTMTQQDQEGRAEDAEDASAAPGQAASSDRRPESGSAASPATEGDSTTLPGTDSPKKGRGKASFMARGRSNSTNLLAMSENPGVETFEDLPQEHVEKALSEKSSRIAKKPTKIPKEEQLRRAIRDMNYSEDLFWNRSLSPKARQRDRILRGKEELDYEKPGIKFGIFPKVKKSLAKPLQPRGILKAPTGLKNDLHADIEEPAIGEEQDQGLRRQPFGASSFGGMGSFGGAGAANPFVADDEEELELLRKQHAEAAERSRQKDLQRQETERLRLEAAEADMDLAKKKAREAILAKQTKEMPKAKAPEPRPAPTAGGVGAPSVAFDLDEKDSDAEAAAVPGDGAKKKDLRSLEATSRDDTPEVDDDSLAEQLWETPDLHADWTAEKADETIKEFDKLKAQPLFNVDVMCLGVHEFHHGLSNLEKCIETYLSNTTHSSTSVLLNSNVRAREGGLFDSPLNVLPKYHVVNVGKQKEKFRIGFMGLLTPDTRHCALSQEVAKQSAVTLTATSTTPAVRMMVTGATPLSGKKKKLLGVGTSGELTSGSSPATSGFAIAAGGEDISSSEKMPEVGGAAGRGAFGGGKRRMLLQRSSSTLHVEDHLGVAGPMPYIQQDGEVFGATAFRKPDTEEEGADDDQQGTSASPATRQSRLKLREDGTTPGVFWLPENADINRSGRPRGGRDGDRPLAVQDVSQSPPLRAARGEPAGPVQLPRLGDRPAEPSSSTSSFVNPQEAPMEAGDLPRITIGSGTPPPGSVEDQQDEHENSSSRAERRGRRPSSAGSGSGGSFADAAAVSSPAAATRTAGGNKSPKKGMMASLRSGSSLSLELDEPVDLPAAEEDELPKRKPRGGFATLRSGSSLSMDEPLDVEVQEVLDQDQASDERTTTGQENYKKKAGKPALASLRSGSSVSLDDPQDFPLEKDDDATSLTDRQSQEITDGGAVEVPFEFGPSAATEAADQFNLTPTSATWAFPKRRTGSRGMSFARGRSGSSILDDPYDEEVGDASHAASRTKKSRIGKIDEEPEKENDPGEEQEKSDEGGSAGGASGRRKSIEWASDVEFGSDHEDLTAKGRAASSAAQRKKFTAVRSGSSLLDQPYDIEVGKTGASTLNVIYPAPPQEQPGGAATKAAALPLSMSSPKRRMFGTGATRSGSSLALDEAFDEEVDERNAMPVTKKVEVHPAVGGAAAQRRSMMARRRSGSSILDEPYSVEIGPGILKKPTTEGDQVGGENPSALDFDGDGGAAARGAMSKKRGSFKQRRSDSSLQFDEPYEIEIEAREEPQGGFGKRGAMAARARSGSSILDDAFDIELDDEDQDVVEAPKLSAAAKRRGSFVGRKSGSSLQFDDPYDVEVGGPLGRAGSFGSKRGAMLARSGTSNMLDDPFDVEVDEHDDDNDGIKPQVGGPQPPLAGAKRRGAFGGRRSGSSLQFDDDVDFGEAAPRLGGLGAGKRGAMAARARSGSSILDDAFDIELDDEDQDVVEAPKLSAAAKRRGSFVGRKSGSSLQFDDPYDVEVGGGPLGRAGSFGSKRGAMRARSGSSIMLDDPFDVEVDEHDDDKDGIKPQVGGPQPPLAGAKRRGAFGGRRSGSSLQFDDDVEFGEAAPRLGGLGAGKRGAMAARARSGSSILDDAFDIELEAEQEDDEDKAGDDGLVLGGPTTRASSASPPIATGASAGAKKRRSFSGLRSGTSTLANIDEESEPSAEGGSSESAAVAAKRKTVRVSRSIEWSQDVVFGDADDDEANAPFSGGQKPGGKRGAFAGGMRSTSSLQLDEPYEVEVQPRKKELLSGDEKRFGMVRRRSGSTLRLQATIDEERAVGEEEDEDESPLDAIASGHTKRAATLKPSRSIEWAADVRFGAAGDDDETEPLASSAHAQAKRGRLLAARSGSSLLDEAYDVDLDVDEQELELEKAASSKPRFGGPGPKQRAGGAFRAMRSGSSILDIAYDEEVDEDVAGAAARTALAPVQPDARAAQRRRMRAMRSGSSITLDDAFDEDLEGIRSEMKANLAGVDFFPVEEVTEMRSILKKTQPIPERDLEKESDSMSQVTFDITATAAERLGESQSSRPAVRRSLGSSTGFGDRLKSSDTLGVDTVVTVSGHTDAERSGSATGSRTGEQENSASTATGDYESILEFQEPRAAANEVVGTALKRLSAVDAVVALTHQSNAEDKELMRTEPDIDLLLGGFEREPLEWYVDAHGKHLGREWDPVEQRFTSIPGPDRLAVKAGPDAVSVIDLWLVEDGDECLMEDPPNPPLEDSDVENMQRDADLVGLEKDARILKKMNRFPTVTSRSPRWKEQRDQPSRTGRRLVVGRHRHLHLTPHRANLKENDEKGFEPDQEFAKVLQKYQKLLNLEDMNLLNFADFDTRLEQIAGLEASKYDNMRRKALDAYISYVKKMEQKRKLGRDTTEEEVKALKNVDNVLDAGRPSVDPDSLCSGVERGLKRPCWTTRDAEWRQITFHSLIADLVLPELVGSAEARRKTLLLLPAIHYLSSYAENGGGRDYGLEDPRFTRKELLVEFIPPLRGFSNGVDDDDPPDPEPNRPPDLSKQKKAELRLVKLTVSGHDLLRLLYESETFLRGTNSYLQFDHSAILLNDFQDLNLPKISEKELKKNKFPGYPGKKRGGPGGRGSGEDGQSVAQSTLGGDETGESTLLWREERDRIEEEARLEALEEVEKEQVEEAINCVMQVARADRMDAAGGVLAFPVSGASSEVSGYDPDERVEGEDEGGDEEEQSYHSASGSEKGEEEDDEEEDRGSGVGSASAKKDADNESLFLSSTETDVFDPNEPIKTKVPSDFQILTVFGETFDRSAFYTIVVPGSLLLTETAKPGDHRLAQPLIVGGQRKRRPRKSDPESSANDTSSEDEDEKRRRYNAAPPVRDQVYNLLKDVVAPLQLGGAHAVKPIVDNAPLLVELALKNLLKDTWQLLSPFWSSQKKFTLGGLKPPPGEFDDDKNLPAIVRMQRRLNLIQTLQRGGKLREIEDPMQVRDDKLMLEKMVNLLDTQSTPLDLEKALEKFQEELLEAEVDKRLFKRAQHERLPSPMSRWAIARQEANLSEGSSEEEESDERSEDKSDEKDGAAAEMDEDKKSVASGGKGSAAGSAQEAAKSDSHSKDDSASVDKALSDSMSLKGSDRTPSSTSRATPLVVGSGLGAVAGGAMSKFRSTGASSHSGGSGSSTFGKIGGEKGASGSGSGADIRDSAQDPTRSARSRRSGASSSRFSAEDELGRIEEEQEMIASRKNSKESIDSKATSAVTKTSKVDAGAAPSARTGGKTATDDDSHSKDGSSHSKSTEQKPSTSGGRSTSEKRKSKSSRKSSSNADLSKYKGVEWGGRLIAKSLSPDRERKRRDTSVDEEAFCDLEAQMLLAQKQMRLEKKTNMGKYYAPEKVDRRKLGVHLGVNYLSSSPRLPVPVFTAGRKPSASLSGPFAASSGEPDEMLSSRGVGVSPATPAARPPASAEGAAHPLGMTSALTTASGGLFGARAGGSPTPFAGNILSGSLTSMSAVTKLKRAKSAGAQRTKPPPPQWTAGTHLDTRGRWTGFDPVDEFVFEMQKKADGGKLARHYAFGMPLESGSETEAERIRERADAVMSGSELEF